MKNILVERVTGLEQFYVCPHKYNSVPFDGSDTKTIFNMYFGDIVHIAHQYPDTARTLLDQLFKKTYKQLFDKNDNSLYDMAKKVIDLVENEYKKKYSEHKSEYEVKTGLVIDGMYIAGSYDCLYKNPKLFELHDYKTAKSKSIYDSWKGKLQPMMYSYFVMKTYNIDKILFKYIIYEKLKNPKYIEKERLFTLKEIEPIIKKVINNFKVAKSTGMFLPQKEIGGEQNKMCYMCPLRTESGAESIGLEQCPMWSFDLDIQFADEDNMDNNKITF